jgi:hypothetical protein
MDGIDLRYCNPSCFQTRGPKVQKWMILLFVHEEFIFHLILNGKILYEKFHNSGPFRPLLEIKFPKFVYGTTITH